MKNMKLLTIVLLGLFLGLSACSSEVGSEAWCEDMQKKDKGDWSSNEAADYAKHCIFK